MAAALAKPPLVVIGGATATGKSRLALRLATARRGVVINADASQCYADLRLLTARPSPPDEAAVPHRLFGFQDGAQPLCAQGWASLARMEVEAVWAAGRLPIVVGGTGLYLRTLLDGLASVPTIDPAVRASVRALAPDAATEALAHHDPVAHARLAPRDTQRRARALEVALSTGHPLAHWHGQRTGGLAHRVALEAIVVERPTDELAEAIVARLRAMLDNGVLDEVATLLARALPPELPIMKAVGLRPFADRLAGSLSTSACLERAAAATRQYAKRQRTWFRNQTPDWRRVQL